MAKNKPGRSQNLTAMHMQRAALASAATSSTSKGPSGAIGDPNNEQPGPGQKVAIPSSEMMGANLSYDYGRLAFFLTLAVAVCGAIWLFADTYFSVKNVAEDVKHLKSKTDDLFRSNASTDARISVLERTEARNSLPGN